MSRRDRHTLLNFIDGHIQEIKWTLYGIGGIGCILIIKNIYGTKRFIRIHDIPSTFIDRNVTLQGEVKRIDGNISGGPDKVPIIWAEHKPILTIPFTKWWKSSTTGCVKDRCIPIGLAGVNLNHSVLDWLNDNVRNKHIWFQLLELEEDRIDAIIKIRRGFLKENINKCLITGGIGKVRDYGVLPKSRLYQDLIIELVRLESKADKKGVGMWSEEKKSYLFQNVISGLKSVITFPYSLYKYIRQK
ncbi:uncharacterized protein LOC126828506 [Patella vulgata]|uniref:uncharacterized protein LOC126828506 n=1 Tax=Patella vulgata TaxID=6465 RepID=UPI0024A90CEA|nr:uncharacterized protein LOC126828506 [Patella vulgata]